MKPADTKGYDDHVDRLLHAQRFCKAVYGVTPSLSATSYSKSILDPTTAQATNLVVDPSERPECSDAKARVTLTFAQSRDGKIAGEQKKMLALSNAESMIMTHMLRVLHDGILVGIGTLLNDNPQLNARLLNPFPDGTEAPLVWLPRPIVLDSRLQTPLGCKLLLNHQSGKGKRPLLVTRLPIVDESKAQALRNAGADILQMPLDAQGRLSWHDVLTTIRHAHGIASVMIEGGATIIESLLREHSKAPIIDDLILTVSSQYVGASGLGYDAPPWLSDSLSYEQSASLKHKQRFTFGSDTVISWSRACQDDSLQ